jgi:hypothetical protein
MMASADPREIKARLKPGAEYMAFEVVAMETLDRFLAAERDRIVPVSLALLDAVRECTTRIG